MELPEKIGDTDRIKRIEVNRAAQVIKNRDEVLLFNTQPSMAGLFVNSPTKIYIILMLYDLKKFRKHRDIQWKGGGLGRIVALP